MSLMTDDRVRVILDTSTPSGLPLVNTGELLAQLGQAAQVIADARGLNVTLVREILLEWEVHRPTHP